MAGEVEIEVILNEGVSQSLNSSLLNSCIEYLIYQRQQVPLPFHELKRIVEDQKKMYDDLDTGVTSARERPVVRRSLNSEEKKAVKVYEDLQCLFDHINKLFLSADVKSAMILLGSTAVSPKESYYITFPRTNQGNHTDLSSRICGSSCRKMIRSLISNQELGSFKEISATSMLVFIQANRNSVIEWFRPKPTFKPPQRGQSCKIILRTNNEPELEDSTDDWIWFQAPVIVKGYRHKTGSAGL